jgi:hypothetical protein
MALEKNGDGHRDGRDVSARHQVARMDLDRPVGILKASLRTQNFAAAKAAVAPGWIDGGARREPTERLPVRDIGHGHEPRDRKAARDMKAITLVVLDDQTIWIRRGRLAG